MISDLVSQCYYILSGSVSSDTSNSACIWKELVNLIPGEYIKTVSLSANELQIEKLKLIDSAPSCPELLNCLQAVLTPTLKLADCKYDSTKRIHFRILMNIIYYNWLVSEKIIDTRLNKFCETYNIPIYGETSTYNPFDVRRKKQGLPSGEIFELLDRVYWTGFRLYNINKIIKSCEKLIN